MVRANRYETVSAFVKVMQQKPCPFFQTWYIYKQKCTNVSANVYVQ